MLPNNFHKWAFLIGTLLFYVALCPSFALATQPEAMAAIASADERIIVCYKATIAAEENGANVTSLIDIMNNANDLLSQAKLAYSSNDFDLAQNLAVQSEQLLNNVVSDADILKENAIQQQTQDFLVNFIVPIFASLIVLGAGLGTWFWLKKRYTPSGEQ